jgi:hypothetical protein
MNWKEIGDSDQERRIDNVLEATKHDEVQGKIAPNIFFRYNSVNVVIGQRGSGKTHFVLREILKLLQFPEANYSEFLYSTSKISKDYTVQKFAELFAGSPLQIETISHDETYTIIRRISEAKEKYNYYRNNPTAAVKSPKYLDTLLKLNVVDTEMPTPHTIIFIDDCIDLLTKRGDLFKELFQNRQAKITYFLGLQDVQGIPSSMKSNIDSLVLFGGFSKQKFTVLFYQIPMDDDREKVYEIYRTLHKSDRMMISFESDGVKKSIVRREN